MNRSYYIAAATLAVALVASTSRATTVINIDFGLQGDHPGGVVSAPYTGAGAAFDPNGGTTWNPVIVVDNNAFQGAPGEFGFWTADVTKPNLLNSQGAATSIGVTLTADAANGTGAFGILQGSPNLGAVATNAVDLMRDYVIGFNVPQKVELTGFAPNTQVDLYLYGAGDTSNRDTLFTVVDANGSHSATTTGTITGDGNNPVTHTLTLGGDYVVLPAVVADGTGKITISYFHGAGSNEAPFNGLQAVFGVLPGDVNGDNLVNMADYQLIRSNFQATGATRALGDLTGPQGGNVGDGVVDFFDFAQWQQHFPSATGAFDVVPEPTGIALAAIAMGGVVQLRRRQRAAARA
ncbi:hypothetical protein [Lacipirellula parvula]|uniref:PEP-CTERM protein-sorting domain-containing protein n=1 Tax=Lacipirellula parvula TaxID=2650471 RepID=A0A5K7XGT4_9BACT|nr:hypothetical protein [Lacipirellula parvula]BBO35252.1 hypothetical protein PLANPX_4864 [Lacipirellula parvula]